MKIAMIIPPIAKQEFLNYLKDFIPFIGMINNRLDNLTLFIITRIENKFSTFIPK